jgi:hypothetical protein
MKPCVGLDAMVTQRKKEKGKEKDFSVSPRVMIFRSCGPPFTTYAGGIY